MHTFAYEARDEDGVLTAGMIKAASLDQAGELLSRQSLFVVRIAADDGRGRRADVRGRATRTQIAWQMSQLSIMVKTGVRLTDALECLARQARQPQLKSLLEQVSRTVQEGRPLSEAMAMYPKCFSASIVAMIRASEMSGTMSLVLHRSAVYLMNEVKALKRIRSAVAYPIFMFALCLAVTIFLLAVILPRFAVIFASRGATLPWPTRVLMGLSDILASHWYLWIGGTLALAVAILFWARTTLGRRQRDYLIISLPVLSKVFNAMYQGRAFRTMAVLLEAGVPLLAAMQVIKGVVPNTYYRELWQHIDEGIQRGDRIATPILTSTLVSEAIAQMIDSGDRSGKLGLVLSHLADFIEEEYDQAVRTATQFIEPAMICCMGGIIGLVAASLMLPLFQSSMVLAK